jgi:hypothetical protein
MMHPLALLLGLALLPGLLGAQEDDAWSERSLSWPRFDIVARLDSSGTLHVREVQTMRFTGAWNGGERRWDVPAGQRFTFRRLWRVDSLTGAEVPLREGDLEAVDEYRREGSSLVRWRSRRPDDPPFADARLPYGLEYEHAGVLRWDGRAYVLDHEFAFRDRDGMIDTLTIALALDSGWEAPATFDGTWEVRALPPGESFVVTTPLTWRGAGQPSAVLRGDPPAVRIGLAAVAALAALALVVAFVRRERAAGRFAPPPDEAVDAAWLERHVFSLRPEVVGAAWDLRVGPAEVAATLARLVSEGKLISSVRTRGKGILRQHVLHLELSAKRDRFADYERALIDRLFPSGSTVTNTAAIRERYAKTGFDPAATIRAGVLAALERVPAAGSVLTPPRTWPVVIALVAAALVAAVVASARSTVNVLACAQLFGVGLGAWFVAGGQAAFWQGRVLRAAPHFVRVLLPLAAFAGWLLWLARDATRPLSAFTIACGAALLLGVTTSVLGIARTRMSTERMALRRRLAMARAHVVRELSRPEPALEDRWYPWLLAFGLNRQVTRWFRAHGGETTTARARGVRATASTTSSFGSSTGGGATWTGFGGGGGFGGAGATVAFGAAVGGMAASISPPSASGSGGSRSSSGGSSGGGGGGGW